MINIFWYSMRNYCHNLVEASIVMWHKVNGITWQKVGKIHNARLLQDRKERSIWIATRHQKRLFSEWLLKQLMQAQNAVVGFTYTVCSYSHYCDLQIVINHDYCIIYIVAIILSMTDCIFLFLYNNDGQAEMIYGPCRSEPSSIQNFNGQRVSFQVKIFSGAA